MKFFTTLCFLIASYSIFSQTLVSLKVDTVQIIFADSSEFISIESHFFFLPRKDTVLSVFKNDSMNVRIDLRKSQSKGRPSASPVHGFVAFPNQVKYESHGDSFVFQTNRFVYNRGSDKQSECFIVAQKSSAETESNVLSVKINYELIAGAPDDVEVYPFPFMQGSWFYYGENGYLYRSCAYENGAKNGNECFFKKGFKTLEYEYANDIKLTQTNYRKKRLQIGRIF